jgi:hypothetical protein
MITLTQPAPGLRDSSALPTVEKEEVPIDTAMTVPTSEQIAEAINNR